MIKRVVHILLLMVVLASAGGVSAEEATVAYEKAVQAYEQGEYEESYIHLKNALREDPNLLSARLLLAQVHFNAGDI